jgi:TonB family protein
VIAKVIKRHENEIKYCYEQELNKTPNLSGKVAVQFVIDPTGAVSEGNVTETSLNNTTTESCMLSRIRRWKFPEPQGGGIVTVTFPWIFKPAGAADEE